MAGADSMLASSVAKFNKVRQNAVAATKTQRIAIPECNKVRHGAVAAPAQGENRDPLVPDRF